MGAGGSVERTQAADNYSYCATTIAMVYADNHSGHTVVDFAMHSYRMLTMARGLVCRQEHEDYTENSFRMAYWDSRNLGCTTFGIQ